MKAIKVNLKKRSYKIIIGNGILEEIGTYLKRLKLGSDAYIITNLVIKNAHGGKLKNSLSRAGFNYKFKLIPDSEKSKSLKTAYSVIEDLAGYDKKKKVFIIPDILCNSGGVFVSYLEYTQETQREQMTLEEVNSRLNNRIVSKFNEVYDYSKQNGLTMRQAAMNLAVSKVVEATRAMGALP